MGKIGKGFYKESIFIDCNTYVFCKFLECDLVYSGLTLPCFLFCNFRGVEWVFTSKSRNTMILIEKLRESYGRVNFGYRFDKNYYESLFKTDPMSLYRYQWDVEHEQTNSLDIDSENSKEVFLYLNEVEHAKKWIEGGKIPINLASSYLSDRREGTNTPDENLIYDTSIPLESIPGVSFAPQMKNFTMKNCMINGMPMPNIIQGNRYNDDGLILSFSKCLDSNIAEELIKKACVKILDINKLKTCIDEQLNCIGEMRSCEYTRYHQRNHFLKSIEDSYMQEYRIFWSRTENDTVYVEIPKGTAVFVKEY